MSDVLSGLSVAESASADVNTDAGFMAAVAKQAGVAVPEGELERIESRSTSVANGLTTEESVRDRDDRGRFTAAAVEDEGAAPTSDQDVADPELAAYLNRHGGDPNAALAAAVKEAREAQSLIGRQGNELGDIRRREQEYAERLARLEGAVAAQPRTPTPLPLTSSQDVEAVEQYVAEHGGYATMAYLHSPEINRPDLVPAALAAWGVDDAVSAAGWNARYQANLVIEEERARQAVSAPAPAPAVQADGASNLASSLDAVKASMPAAEWSLVRERLSPLLAEDGTPEAIKIAVVSPDRATQIEGVKALVAIARGRAIAEATATATSGRAGEVRQAKLAAGVATGSLRPVPEPAANTGTSRADAIASFHRTLMSTETTSVADGLTYGK